MVRWVCSHSGWCFAIVGGYCFLGWPVPRRLCWSAETPSNAPSSRPCPSTLHKSYASPSDGQSPKSSDPPHSSSAHKIPSSVPNQQYSSSSLSHCPRTTSSNCKFAWSCGLSHPRNLGSVRRCSRRLCLSFPYFAGFLYRCSLASLSTEEGIYVSHMVLLFVIIHAVVVLPIALSTVRLDDLCLVLPELMVVSTFGRSLCRILQYCSFWITENV